MHVKLLLCGFMGAGKTTLLSKFEHNQMGFDCVDLDGQIASDLNISPHKLGDWIENFGFPLFRKKEDDLLKNLLNQKRSMVIALGGGALSAEILNVIHKNPDYKLVFLNTSFDTCLERIKNDKLRPLAKLDPIELKKLYDERYVIYSQADLILSQSDIKEIEGLDSLVHNLLSMNLK